MSRIGRMPVILEDGVEVKLSIDRIVTIVGNSKSLEFPLNKNLDLKQENGKVIISCKTNDKKTKALHGLSRTLIQNAVIGITKGWSKSLELNGVGYKANLKGTALELNLGFSHPISLEIPKELKVTVEKQNKIVITGYDKEYVGRFAHKIRSFRPPEPYLGKGVKYSDEVIRKKAGKSGGEKK